MTTADRPKMFSDKKKERERVNVGDRPITFIVSGGAGSLVRWFLRWFGRTRLSGQTCSTSPFSALLSNSAFCGRSVGRARAREGRHAPPSCSYTYLAPTCTYLPT